MMLRRLACRVLGEIHVRELELACFKSNSGEAEQLSYYLSAATGQDELRLCRGTSTRPPITEAPRSHGGVNVDGTCSVVGRRRHDRNSM